MNSMQKLDRWLIRDRIFSLLFRENNRMKGNEKSYSILIYHTNIHKLYKILSQLVFNMCFTCVVPLIQTENHIEREREKEKGKSDTVACIFIFRLSKKLLFAFASAFFSTFSCVAAPNNRKLLNGNSCT